MKASIVLAMAALWLVGCASSPPLITHHLSSGDVDSVELRSVPFFPQEAYQCGPAALATILVASGADTSADELTSEVYLPGRRGSLQLELIATVRRHGFVPYRLHHGLRELLAQVNDGRPVLALLNPGPSFYPLWHYAVVVGYSALDDSLVLRSGTTHRKVMPTRRFLRQWRDSDQWALLALAPGELPAEPNPDELLKAAAALEATGNLVVARQSYSAAVQHWPDNANARLGLGNTLHQLGDTQEAEKVLRDLLSRHPDHAVARNNLAHILMERGCIEEARNILATVLNDTTVNRQVHAIAEKTNAELALRSTRIDPSTCAESRAL